MNDTQKTFKQICTCEKCGNEAEMMVTCRLAEVEAAAPATGDASAGGRVKGTATCSHCGNEADMWIDL